MKDNREIVFKEKFEKTHPGFEYYSGYKNVDSYFKSKCKKCGYIQERHAQCTRPYKAHREIKCYNCLEKQKVKKQKYRKQELEDNQTAELILTLIKLINSRIENTLREPLLSKTCQRCGNNYRANSIKSVHCDQCVLEIKKEQQAIRKLWDGKIIQCYECGQDFSMTSSRSKYCSLECLNRSMARVRELRKRTALKNNGKIDNSITLSKLINRYRNICKLCGLMCNGDDYIISEEGHFIVGKTYPTIDHIIPISKGGTHTWNNVQLAHHYCNSIKSDNLHKDTDEAN